MAGSCDSKVAIEAQGAHEGGGALAAELAALLALVASVVCPVRAFDGAACAVPHGSGLALTAVGAGSAAEAPHHAREALQQRHDFICLLRTHALALLCHVPVLALPAFICRFVAVSTVDGARHARELVVLLC